LRRVPTDGMKIVSLDTSLQVEIPTEESRSIHGELFPDNVRCLMLGSSGCGKTSLLAATILHPHGFAFKSLKVFSPSTKQPVYEIFEKIFEELPEIQYSITSDLGEIPRVEELKKHDLLVFDDCQNSSAIDVKNLSQLFSRGRHKSVNIVFILQYYKACDISIRANFNFLCLFPISASTLKEVHSEHVSACAFRDFKKVCDIAWANNNFVIIDKQRASLKIGFDKNVLF
jgi:hypothetical protein